MHESVAVTFVSPSPIADAGVLSPEEFGSSPYHRDDDVSELALLRHQVSELGREIRAARDMLDESVRIATRRERVRSVAQGKRQKQTRGAAAARAILRLMVAVFTLGGLITGLGVAVTIIHLWGDSASATVAAVVFGLTVALGAWLLAALAAIVLETADAVRSIPV
jgi:uncharacterized membrane protein